MTVPSGGNVSFSQLSRKQGFCFECKRYGTLLLLYLCAALGVLPGVFVCYKWGEGKAIVTVSAIIIGVIGALLLAFYCFRKCSRAIQGTILADVILGLLGFAIYFVFVIVFYYGCIYGSIAHDSPPQSQTHQDILMQEEPEVQEQSMAENSSEDNEESANPILYNPILYREEENGRRSFSVVWFDDDTHATLYSGLVGELGKATASIDDYDLSIFNQKLQDAVDDRQKLGYYIRDEHDKLIVEYSVSGDVDSPEEFEKCQRLQVFLNRLLCLRGIGICDGNRTYSGVVEIRCIVMDYDLAERCISEALEDTELAFHSRIHLQ
jgi:hypothetical protein